MYICALDNFVHQHMKSTQQITLALSEFLDLIDTPGKLARYILNAHFDLQIRNAGLPSDPGELEEFQCLVNFLIELEELKKERLNQ
jgi:hypothetical protein